MNVMSALKQISDNANSTLQRFAGNEALLARFLKKFPQDNTFAELESAMRQKDYEAALYQAHTLKGVAGNLGFSELYCESSSMVDHLRAEEYDKAQECFSFLARAYHTVIVTLESLDKEGVSPE